MRPDMKEVIIERPRGGSRGKINLKLKKPSVEYDDNGPTKMSARKILGWDKREQNDVLGPLRRYLRKQVGRPWNDIWSEICRNNKDFMGDHLKRHIDYEVERNLFIEDGKLFRDNGRPFWDFVDTLYVDPVTGILCLYKAKPKRRLSKVKKTIYSYEGKLYHKHSDGLWYEVTVEDDKHTAKTDVFGHSHPIGLARSKYCYDYKNRAAYGYGVICTSKRQIGKRLIKKLEQLL